MINIDKNIGMFRNPFRTESTFPNLLEEKHIHESIKSHYQILSGLETYYSQIFSEYRFPSEDFQAEQAFIKFMVIDSRLGTKHNRFIKERIRKILLDQKKISHIALIDPFGGIQQITGKNETDDLQNKIHGGKIYSNIGDWDGYKVTTFNPFGWIATSNQR